MTVQQCADATTAPVKVHLDHREAVYDAVDEVFVIAQGFDLGGDVDNDPVVGEVGHSPIESIDGGHGIHLGAGSLQGSFIKSARLARLGHQEDARG